MNKPFFPQIGLPRTPYINGGASAQPAPQLPASIQALLALPLEHFRQHAEVKAEPMTYASMVLDESTSMGPHRGAALEGFNAQVGVIKEGAKHAGTTRVGLTVFNSTVRPVMVARPVEELRPLTMEEYRPNGGTALFDAIGQTLETLLEQPYINSPTTAVLVAIFTDGEENSSRRYSGPVLKELVSRLEATGRWTFTLMGPQGSSVELASVLNLQSGNVAMFNPQDAVSTKSAFASMTAAAGSYMALRSRGITASACLYAAPDEHA